MHVRNDVLGYSLLQTEIQVGLFIEPLELSFKSINSYHYLKNISIS